MRLFLKEGEPNESTHPNNDTPVYGLLVKAGAREIGSLPEQYQIPVAEYLAAQVEQ